MEKILICPYCKDKNITVKDNISKCLNCSYSWHDPAFLQLPLPKQSTVNNDYVDVNKIKKSGIIRYRNRHLLRPMLDIEKKSRNRADRPRKASNKNSSTTEKLTYDDNKSPRENHNNDYDLSKIKTQNTPQYLDTNHPTNSKKQPTREKEQPESSRGQSSIDYLKERGESTEPKKPSLSSPALDFFANLEIKNESSSKQKDTSLKSKTYVKEAKPSKLKGFYKFLSLISERRIMIYIGIIILAGLLYFKPSIKTSQNHDNLVENSEERQNTDNQVRSSNKNPASKASRGTSETLVIDKVDPDVAIDEDSFIVAKDESEDSAEILLKQPNSSQESSPQSSDATVEGNNSTFSEQNSWFNKTMQKLQQKTSNFFGNLTTDVSSNHWVKERGQDYFAINLKITNKSANKSYVVEELEVVILDSSNNIVNKKTIYSDTVVRANGKKTLTIKIPNSPSVSAKSYVNLKKVVEQ